MNLVFNSPKRPFYQGDLYLDTMTLILKLDLDIGKNVKAFKSYSLHRRTHTDRKIDRHTDSMKTLPSRIRGR